MAEAALNISAYVVVFFDEAYWWKHKLFPWKSAFRPTPHKLA